MSRFLIARVPRLETHQRRRNLSAQPTVHPSTATTLAFVSRLLGRVLANMSLALVGDRLANVFSQVVPIFAAILTVIPGA
jgi:hypothetical protein